MHDRVMTARPYGSLDPQAYERHLRTAADGLLAAIRGGPTTAAVASCPDWTVHDLVEHLGQVHRWAGLAVVDGRPPRRGTIPGVPAGVELGAWYAEQFEWLVGVLTEAGPDRPCWAHQPDRQVTGYWWRRQAHELAMHRVDVDQAVGRAPTYDPELAADGIAEVLDVWLERLHAWAAIRPDLAGPVLLSCTDRAERWLLHPRPDSHPRADGPRLSDTEVDSASARIRGPAADLLLALWKRSDPRPVLTIEGDAAVAARFLDSTLTP